jgi:catechol 2,3-dioxygenase-like lactoylglutathione lyase family enzyme
MSGPKRAIRGLGEIGLRVKDLGRMQRFYEETIGLQLLKSFPHAGFFRIADGYGGHTQVLALFDRSGMPGYGGLSAEKSTVDHVAFEISRSDYEREKDRLEQLGQRVETAEHTWVHGVPSTSETRKATL